MANYGNAFTYNSGNFKFTTNGHQEDDDGWVILNAPLKQISYKHYQAEAIGNNVTTYGVGDASLWPDSIENFYNVKDTKNGTYYYTYFEWRENKNLIGSISGAFSCYVFNKNSRYLAEPTTLDDINHGIIPYINSRTKLYTESLPIKGTRDTRGYRKNKIQYTPDIDADYASHLDGTSAKNARVDSVTRYDAFQTFYNYKDPYARLYLDIKNYDNPKSSTPTFCTISDLRAEYRINHSYTYNPYIDTATWDKNIYISFSHNLLSTYKKALVLTYPSNYNNISYNGANFNIEAKAYYNNSYDGFTTSTATDVCFSSYKRYAYLSYHLIVENSSTVPSGLTYTICMWQPGSELKISYRWSIDGNPSWATITGSKNIGNLTINPQDAKKGSISGKLKIDCQTSGNSGETSTKTDITGITFISPNNGTKRSCTVRQNMEISNCYEQNITPKDENGQPYQIITVTQNPAVWEEPAFRVKVKCVQLEKTNKPVSDNLNFGWPRFYIGQVWQPSNISNEKLLSLEWKSSNVSSKQFYVKYPTINAPHTLSDCSGYFAINSNINLFGNALPPKNAYIRNIEILPNITFKKAKYEGYSERKWVLSCTSIEPTVELDNKLEGFDPITFTMNGMEKSGFKSGVVTFTAVGALNNSLDGNTVNLVNYVDEVTMVASDTEPDETLDFSKNSNYRKLMTIGIADNPGYIGNFKVDYNRDSNLLYVSSTSYDSSPRNLNINIYGTPSENGTIIGTSNNFNINQNGSSINGTIKLIPYNCGLCNDMYCFDETNSPYLKYPVGTTYSSYSVDFPFNSQRYINGIGTVDIVTPLIFDVNPKKSISNNISNTKIDTKFNPDSDITTTHSISVSYYGGSYEAKFVGIPSIESEESKTVYWHVDAISNIGPTEPVGGNPVAYGYVTPNDAKYTYQIQINNSSWIDLSNNCYAITVPNITGPVIYAYNAYFAVDKTYTDVKDGIYKYFRGRYKRISTNENNFTIKGRVVDYYDNHISYNCTYDLTITQKGDPGEDYYKGGQLYITNDNDWNCTVGAINDTTWDSDNNYLYKGGTDSDAANVGSFDVTPDWFASHSTPPTGNNATVDQNYVANYKDSTMATETRIPTVSVTFIGSDKEFGIGETISYVIGVSSATPDSITITQSWVGAITWTYKYRYSVSSDSANDSDWFFTTKEANASYYKPSVINTYYKYIKYGSGAWTRFTGTSSRKTVTSLGVHRVYICWAKTQSDCSTSNRQCFQYHSIKLTQQTSTTEYEYQVIINISVTSGANVIHSAFDTNTFSSSVTATAEGQARSRTVTNGVVGDWGTWEKWVDLTPTVTYSGVVSGTGTTATGAYTSIAEGKNGTTLNSGKVTFTATATWANAGGKDRTASNTATATWMRYGKTISEQVSISLNTASKTITAFDEQTLKVVATPSHTVIASSNGATMGYTKDWTSKYPTPSVTYTAGSITGKGTTYTLVAVQGTNSRTIGATTVSFKAVGTYDNSKTTTVTCTLSCYGIDFYNA